MSQVFVSKHPLVQHKLAVLRDKDTDHRSFRELMRELAMLLCYEATQDIPLSPRTVNTPMGEAIGYKADEAIGLIPVLRAGLGMLEGMMHRMDQRDIPNREDIRVACAEHQVDLRGPRPDALHGGELRHRLRGLRPADILQVELPCVLRIRNGEQGGGLGSREPDGEKTVSAQRPDTGAIHLAAKAGDKPSPDRRGRRLGHHLRDDNLRQPGIAGRLKPKRHRPGPCDDVAKTRIKRRQRLKSRRDIGLTGNRSHRTLLGIRFDF